MNKYSDLKKRVILLINDSLALTEELKYDKSYEEVRRIRDAIDTDFITVVVAGEFKQGKSSLLNAFIEGATYFPVDLDITTNLISTIRFGEDEKITVWMGEEGKEKPVEITRDQIWEYATEQNNPSSKRRFEVHLLEIESPIPKLKDGLLFVDTPGVGGLNIEHTNVTYTYIPNADIVLFVSDVHEVMTTEELDFVKRIKEYTDHILFVVTKIDARNDYESVIESNRAKLKDILEKPEDEIVIIPVSSRLKIDYLEDKEEEDLEDSNFPLLEENIWDIVNANRAGILLEGRVAEIGKALSDVYEEYKSSHADLSNLSDEEIANHKKKIKKEIESFEEFSRSNAPWRRELTNGVDEISDKMLGSFSNKLTKIRKNANDYMEDKARLEKPSSIAGLVEGEIAGAIVKIDKSMKREVAQLHKRITEKYEELEIAPFNKLTDFEWEEKRPDLTGVQVKRTGSLDKAVEATKTGLFSGNAGAVLGGVIGGVVGGVIGFFAGGVGAIPGAVTGAALFGGVGKVGGAASGAKKRLRSIEKQDADVTRKQVLKVLNPYFDDVHYEGKNALKKSLRDLKYTVSDSIDNEIRRKRANHKKQLKRLREIGEKKKKESLEEIRKSKEILRKIAALHKNAKNIYNDIAG